MASRYEHYSDEALAALRLARKFAVAAKRNVCAPQDLLHACLLTTPQVRETLARQSLKVADEKVRGLEQVAAAAPAAAPSGPKLALDPGLRKILDKAETLATKAGHPHVTPLHLLHAGWASFRDALCLCLDAPDAGAAARLAAAPLPPLTAEGSGTASGAAAQPSGSTPAPARPTALARLAQELTRDGVALQPVIGRERELDDVIGVLCRRLRRNVMLLGGPGVGKSALVEGLASRLREGRVPPALQGCRVFSLPVGNLLAGTTTHGSFEARMRELVEELESTPDAILFLDEAHLLNQRDRGSTNPSEHLKPALARGRFRCIAATTPADYYRCLQADGAFVRRFQTIHLDEPDAPTTLAILKGCAPDLAGYYGLDLPDALLEHAVRLGQDLLVHRRFPDKGLDLVDAACADATMRGAGALSKADLDAVATRMAGLAVGGSAPAHRLTTLEATLSERVLGQPEAIRAVCGVLRLCKRRLDLRPERPDGVFLFSGPSGVGKTALAEALAEVLCGDAAQLERFDMSEFAEPHKISRLTGSPPGYVGYGGEPELTRAARRHPNGVLLLDEFDKAHADVQRLFLQVFDSGRLTDSMGETASFSNMTIILTANLPLKHEHSSIGFGGAKDLAAPTPADEAERLGLRAHLPAELISRLDAVVAFRPLDREQAGEILSKRLLTRANEALRERWQVELELTAAAVEAVLDAGHSAELGVRDLQRRFQELVMQPLAEFLPTTPPETPGVLRRVQVDRQGGAALSLTWLDGSGGSRRQPPARRPRRRTGPPRTMTAAA
ncbi:MAG: ATP-dependent Clp protease ATP-binding subunit [Lentisphaerae bacterium]|nr:ATP-dependent Clp protease ATP-binding subunit [Lentisphaerota bacterium]